MRRRGRTHRRTDGVDGGGGMLGHGPATMASDRAPTAEHGQQWGQASDSDGRDGRVRGEATARSNSGGAVGTAVGTPACGPDNALKACEWRGRVSAFSELNLLPDENRSK
jgi:hypothetical protein